MRVAIVHPWFLAFGGAEQTVNELAEIFPEADFFTLYSDPKTLPPKLRGRRLFVSGFNRLPARFKLYRYLLPLYPSAFERLDLTGYDLIVTSDSCFIKGILTDPGATHVCYCHSPMRCLYDEYRLYLKDLPAFARPIFRLSSHYLRIWDFVAAQRVDLLIANSHNVARRIRTYYGRDCEVIYPPVRVEKGYIDERRGDYFLCTGRLTRSKRIDLLIQACNELKKPLVIVGSGREKERLMAIAGGTIKFAGRVSDEKLGELYARCRAFVFAADEDFGIVPVEAQSYGRPVIGFGRGGLLETVIENETGVFFKDQSVDAVVEAINVFESIESRFDPEAIKKHASEFDSAVFKKRIRETSLSAYERKQKRFSAPWKSDLGLLGQEPQATDQFD